MKQLRNVSLWHTPDEVRQLFGELFPEFDKDVGDWEIWFDFNEEARGLRLHLKQGPMVLFLLMRDPEEGGWNVARILLVPAPEPFDPVGDAERLLFG